MRNLSALTGILIFLNTCALPPIQSTSAVKALANASLDKGALEWEGVHVLSHLITSPADLKPLALHQRIDWQRAPG